VSIKKFKELKDLSKDELTTRVREVEGQLFKLRMEHKTGQLENTAALGQNRKALAQMKMLLGQKDKAQA